MVRNQIPLPLDAVAPLTMIHKSSTLNLALLEACLQTPILVPVPNCSFSRCRWIADEAQAEAPTGEGWMRSKKMQTMSDQRGWWLMDYQTHTSHLARDLR